MPKLAVLWPVGEHQEEKGAQPLRQSDAPAPPGAVELVAVSICNHRELLIHAKGSALGLVPFVQC